MQRVEDTYETARQVAALADVLFDAYGVDPVDVTRIQAGTSTRNYVIVDSHSERWFAKVYRDRSTLRRELEAVELAQFTRAGGVQVPRVRPTNEAT